VTCIFCLDEEQRRVADATVAELDASGPWPGKVVTEVTPAGTQRCPWGRARAMAAA
jgi:Peptide methionine sulfoxide reductase